MLKVPIVVFAAASFVKLLLIPAYRSTDFEVHRNWLAITHSLPLSKWYYEDTSEWTLDYPPFFAWFEWTLSQFATVVDPLMVAVESLNYTAHSCVLFQRLSVIICDLTLLYAVIQFCRYHGNRSCDKKDKAHDTTQLILSLLVLCNYGLLVVDHVHFQYNGFLFGILLLSLTRILQSRFLEGAFLFAVLLNLKHLFLYVAPAYFVYLLKCYCFSGGATTLRNFLPNEFLKLASVVAATFVVSFGPFIYMGQLSQVISRLFPFKRGLCHAYWAPNVWALYSFADKLLAAAGGRFGLISGASTGGMTSGLVGEIQLQALPDIVPMATAVITLLAMMPALVKLWFHPATPVDFLKTVLACAYASFLFGWHIHEKAIMMITLPMCLLVIEEKKFARIFLILSTSGHVSLFPLLFKPAVDIKTSPQGFTLSHLLKQLKTPIKLGLFLLYTAFGFTTLIGSKAAAPIVLSESEAVLTAQIAMGDTSSEKSPHAKISNSPLFTYVDSCCFFLLFLVQFYCLFLHANFVFLSRYEFLPLLLTSVSCALGVVWSWVLFCKAILAS